MTAFRILDQAPVFFDLEGQLCVGGNLHFYDAGTTTDKDVYGDMALSVNNGPVIAIGTDGRSVHDVWGSGNYRCRLYDGNSTLVWDRDNIEIAGGSGTAIPALLTGQFLTNDGAVLQWANVRQVPDPTGKANNLLSTDGTNIIWIAPPTAPTLSATVTANSLQITQGSLKWVTQTGTDTAPASGTYTTTRTITFPIPFTTCTHASAQPLTNSNPGGPMVSYPSAAASPTSVTFIFDIAEGNPTQSNVINPVPFTWVAMGTVAV